MFVLQTSTCLVFCLLHSWDSCNQIRS